MPCHTPPWATQKHERYCDSSGTGPATHPSQNTERMIEPIRVPDTHPQGDTLDPNPKSNFRAEVPKPKARHTLLKSEQRTRSRHPKTPSLAL